MYSCPCQHHRQLSRDPRSLRPSYHVFLARLLLFRIYRLDNSLPLRCASAFMQIAVVYGSKSHSQLVKSSNLSYQRSFFASQSPIFPLTLFLLLIGYFLPSALVRHSTARVIAAIAGIEIPVGGWPQLLPFLHETATSSEAAHREVGIYILYTVLETIVEGFQEHLQAFFKLFEGLLQDPESAEVRVTTVR